MENRCTGQRYDNEFFHLSSIKNWHGKFGHLNVLIMDHDDECTGYGKHDRIVNYGDLTGRIDNVWNLGTPSDNEIIKYYKKEYGVKGRLKIAKKFYSDKSIYFELLFI